MALLTAVVSLLHALALWALPRAAQPPAPGPRPAQGVRVHWIGPPQTVRHNATAAATATAPATTAAQRGPGAERRGASAAPVPAPTASPKPAPPSNTPRHSARPPAAPAPAESTAPTTAPARVPAPAAAPHPPAAARQPAARAEPAPPPATSPDPDSTALLREPGHRSARASSLDSASGVPSGEADRPPAAAGSSGSGGGGGGGGSGAAGRGGRAGSAGGGDAEGDGAPASGSGSGSAGAAYLHHPKPPYPTLSRRLGEVGQVRLRVLVGPDGRPQQVRLQRSSGHRRLDDAAIDGVRGWRFKPRLRDGAPESAWVEQTITFELE